MLMWMGNMKDKNELRIKCCSGSQDVGCGFDYRPDRNIVGGRWARRSLTANSHRRMTYASASTMTHHSSSCSRSSTYIFITVCNLQGSEASSLSVGGSPIKNCSCSLVQAASSSWSWLLVLTAFSPRLPYKFHLLRLRHAVSSATTRLDEK